MTVLLFLPKRVKVYRHKTDKHPILFYENEIKEHALKKDTVIFLACAA